MYGEVVKALRVILVEGTPPKRLTPRSMDAYTHFLKARHFSDRRTKDDAARAVAVLKGALDLDPNDAAAWADLARLRHAVQQLLYADRLEEAEAVCRQAIDLGNGATGQKILLGRILLARGKLEEAREAVALDTKGDPLLRNLERDPRHRAFLRKMRLPA